MNFGSWNSTGNWGKAKRRQARKIGRGPTCPNSGARSTRVNERDQCEECGRVLRVRADGTWPLHAYPGRGACAKVYSTFGSRCDRATGHQGPCGGGL